MEAQGTMNIYKSILEALSMPMIEFEWDDGEDFEEGNDEFTLYTKINNNIVGEVNYHMNHFPTIDSINVDKEYRHKGIASSLIEQLVNRFGEYKNIYWNSLYLSGLKLKEKLDDKYNLSEQERKSNWYGMVEDKADEWKVL